MISKEEVKHIADLARLGLSKEEVLKMQKDLSSILDYFKQLEEVDTTGTEPVFYSNIFKNVTRKDTLKEEPIEQRAKLIKAAPEKEKGYVKVKNILKDGNL